MQKSNFIESRQGCAKFDVKEVEVIAQKNIAL